MFWKMFPQDNEIDSEVEQKQIRSPSMRLRFGRRNDPMMSLYNEARLILLFSFTLLAFLTFLVVALLVVQENMLYGNEPLTRKAQRTPSVRLRFGKRGDSLLENEVRISSFSL